MGKKAEEELYKDPVRWGGGGGRGIGRWREKKIGRTADDVCPKCGGGRIDTVPTRLRQI